MSGSEGGPGRRASRDAGTAPRSDPYRKLRALIDELRAVAEEATNLMHEAEVKV